jgi:prevent-host-death family protein
VLAAGLAPAPECRKQQYGPAGRQLSKLYTLYMSEMPITEAREHISELVGRARYGHQAIVLTHYGSPAAVVISFEEYQRLKHAAGEADAPEYQLPPEIEAVIEEGRRHPERRTPYHRRTPRQSW